MKEALVIKTVRFARFVVALVLLALLSLPSASLTIKVSNILVILATVVTLLPLAAFGGVASAQQARPMGGAVAGERQTLNFAPSAGTAAAILSTACFARGVRQTVSVALAF